MKSLSNLTFNLDLRRYMMTCNGGLFVTIIVGLSLGHFLYKVGTTHTHIRVRVKAPVSDLLLLLLHVLQPPAAAAAAASSATADITADTLLEPSSIELNGIL